MCEGVSMSEADILRFLDRRGVIEILEYLEQEGRYYTDLKEILDISILNVRLQELLDYGLIQYHSIDYGEWYFLTEKGYQIVDLLRDIETLLGCSHG